jgi:hypothetical protein
MKIGKKIFVSLVLAISLLYQNCKLHTHLIANKDILFVKKHYAREEGVFHLGEDSTDIDYVIKWKERTKNKEKTAFLPNISPSVKDTIKINFYLESLNPSYRYETVSIFVDNTLIKEDSIPSKFAYSEYFSNFSKYLSVNYCNTNRLKSANIMIALHTQKRFFDTIIPLRFNIIDVKRLGGNFDFSFSGVYFRGEKPER